MFWLFVASIVVIVIASLLPGSSANLRSYSDKFLHFLGYAVAGVLAVYGLPSFRVRVRWLAYLFLLGVALEFVQHHVPGRTFELFDILANTLGTTVGLVMAWRSPDVWGHE